MLTTKSNIIDYGAVNQGVPLHGEFTLTNSFSEDIEITAATSSCGCTVPFVKFGRLPSGTDTIIKFVLNTENRRGDVMKTIHITYLRKGKKETFSQKIKTHVLVK